MLSLLERGVESIEERLVLLAPPDAEVPGFFESALVDADRHRELVYELQQLRGRVYLDDGAVQRQQLSADGRHQTSEDERSWHLLMMNKHRRVSSCAWYLEHDNPTSMQELRVRACPLAHHDGWRDRLTNAVHSELNRAREGRLRYAEVGGWAVAKDSRCTSEGLVLALAAYSLGRALGGALGLTTATVRHASSTILRRLGGSHLEVDGTSVPAYYDPKYGCDMEILRFDSRHPNPKYGKHIDRLSARLANVTVIVNQAAASAAA